MNNKYLYCFVLILCLSGFILSAYASEPVATHTHEVKARYEAYVDSADDNISAKKWDIAEKFTILALRTDPSNPSNWLLWANLGEIRNQLNDYDGAIEAYTVGLNRNSGSPRMLEGRAAARLHIGKYEEALEDLNSLLSIDSIREWPRLMRAMILSSRGDKKQAAEDYQSVISHHPENASAYIGLGQLAASEGRIDDAINLYRESLKKEEDELTRIYLISALADSGKLSEASETLRESMKIYQRNGNMFLLRAYIHKLNFHNQEAEIDRKLALEYGADPELVDKIFNDHQK